MERKALFYEKVSGNNVKCYLCPHECLINNGKWGLCRVRTNKDGCLYSVVYGRCVALHVDPIEKKPLYHFLPNSSALSMATVGCNLRCSFCQNADIAQYDVIGRGVPGELLLPEEIVEVAEKKKTRVIAYTYTEPTIYFEYAYDTAKHAAQRGIKNVFVSNGYISIRALDYIEPYLDGINVDLKSFDDNFYKKYLNARLDPVLETLKYIANSNIWLEITTLVIRV
ncbi:MAG: AmmeMemoRadiSam system radical SAM enzyme [Candidatus Theseobacter exili]|nr:AmmeMemoRadiSam system radical SAM enzyme [Candidatus Theseobacter exili]